MLAAVRAPLQRRYRQWLARRMPASRQQRLTQQRIFILPTRYGLFFLLIAALLFLGGINYENNLIMALSFLMTSLFMIAILHTFRNLAGLLVRAGQLEPGHAGAEGALEILLHADDRHPHLSLWLRWPGGPVEEVSVLPGEEKSVWLRLPLKRRGRVHPGRLHIESRYPLGLLRAWSQLDMAHPALAWPRAAPSEFCPASGGDAEQGLQHTRLAGSDDFQGLRSYRPGDPPRMVDWKAYARGRGLHSKYFADPAEGWLWLDWAMMPGVDPETRLSRLTWWVLQLEQKNQRYGLRLPGAELPPGLGPEQQRQALDLLALYGEEVA